MQQSDLFILRFDIVQFVQNVQAESIRLAAQQIPAVHKVAQRQYDGEQHFQRLAAHQELAQRLNGADFLLDLLTTLIEFGAKDQTRNALGRTRNLRQLQQKFLWPV